jgi:hypothetical protein
MTHLTLTGAYAGAPICGAKRNQTDKYIHFAYATDSLTPADLCPTCAHVANCEQDPCPICDHITVKATI